MPVNKIVLTGSSGLIGTSLIRNLRRKRIPIITLHRHPLPGSSSIQPGFQELWDPYGATPMSDPQVLSGATAAVHLSGVNLAARRWTPSYKREILESRVKTTHALATMLAGLRPRPEVLVCSSAIGFYGGCGDEVLTEDSLPGSGFIPELCQAWEKATRPAADAGIRVVHVRFGVVLSPDGGALAQMLPVFRAGLGGRLGSGRQWISWVSLPDATGAIEFALASRGLSGPINLVAPNPVTNLDFTRSLGRALRRPALLRVPAFALRLAFGEMADATILESVRVLPVRLSAAGFQFEHPALDSALAALLPQPQNPS
jgi:uncharacterized protein